MRAETRSRNACAYEIQFSNPCVFGSRMKMEKLSHIKSKIKLPAICMGVAKRQLRVGDSWTVIVNKRDAFDLDSKRRETPGRGLEGQEDGTPSGGAS